MDLVYLESAGELRRVVLSRDTKTVRVGRSESADVVLRDPRVSRDHAVVESVGGLFLLRDSGSSNGTFLNGTRIPSGNAYVLREGDRIEIGSVRFACRGSSEGIAADEPFLVGEDAELSCRVDDLLRERRSSRAREDEDDLVRAFSGTTRARGLERCLEVVARAMAADVVAIFAPGGVRDVEVQTALPSREAALPLVDVARSIMASDRGLIRRRWLPATTSGARTRALAASCTAAVPIFSGSIPLGVLAIERRAGRALDRAALARLAALGQRLAATLALLEGDLDDTRLGLEIVPAPGA